MKHSNNFEVGMQIVYKIFTILGLNIFNPAYRPNWRTACCVGLALFGNLNVFYTLLHHRNDFKMTLRCLCAAPEAFQGVVKLYTIMKHGKTMVTATNFIRKVYRENKETGPVRNLALEQCSTTLVSCVKVVIFVFVFILAAVAIYPIYSIIFLGKRELFFEILIVGYEVKSLADYIFYLIVQGTETIFAFTGNNTCDLLLCILIIHISLLAGIFKAALKETAELIGTDNRMVRISLRNCILMHQDLINYILTMNRIYATTFFYQTATASLSLALNCFCIVKTDWLGAYGFGVFSMMKIFTFCVLGTFVEIKSDEILQSLSNFPWYLLPIDCQKMIFMAMMRSQKFPKLMIAKVANLNVATGAKIIKAIYSYLMMLLNVDA